MTSDSLHTLSVSLQEERRKALEKHGIGRRVPIFIPLKWIATPPQVRRRIDQDWVKKLAHLIIASHGCENPPIVWVNTEAGFKDYLGWIREIWGDDHNPAMYQKVRNGQGRSILCEIGLNSADIDQLYGHVLHKSDFYLPVVAGACRTRAYRYIWDHGCNDCIQTFGKERPGKCFKRHFGGEFVKVQLSAGDDPGGMFEDMFAENNYKEPDQVDLAEGIALFYLFKSKQHGNGKRLSYQEFSQRFSTVPPDKIGEAIRWKNLPDFVKDRVANGMEYGIALQLARLQAEGFSDGDLQNHLVMAVTGKWTVDKTREVITRVIKTSRSDKKMSASLDLLDLMGDAQKVICERHKYKKVAAANSQRAAYNGLVYLRQLNDLYSSGLLGQEDSIYAEGNIRQYLLSLFERAKETTAQVRSLSEAEKKDGIASLDEAIASLQSFEGQPG